jgi:hypothetical protein
MYHPVPFFFVSENFLFLFVILFSNFFNRLSLLLLFFLLSLSLLPALRSLRFFLHPFLFLLLPFLTFMSLTLFLPPYRYRRGSLVWRRRVKSKPSKNDKETKTPRKKERKKKNPPNQRS